MSDGGVSTVAPGNVICKVPGIGVATLRAIKSAPSAFVVPCKNKESSMLIPSALATDSVMPLAEFMNGRAEHEENGGEKRGGIDDPLAAAAATEASTYGSIVIPLMAGDHKQPNRISKPKATKTRLCESEGCSMEASFGYDGKRKRKYCSTHRLPGMINVKHKRCTYKDCMRQPSYGMEGEKASYCSNHKSAGMVNLVRRRCSFVGCSRLPSFGLEGEKPKFCVAHKEPDMVDVANRRCETLGCNRHPSYAMKGDRIRRFCSDHKTDAMINVKKRKCYAKSCRAEAMPGGTGYCAMHSPPTSCGVVGCKKTVTYGLPGGPAMWCDEHCGKGMTVLVPSCRMENCNEISFAASGFCEHHACQEHMDVDGLSVAVTVPRRKPGRPRKKPKSPLPGSTGASRTSMDRKQSIQSKSSLLNVAGLPPASGSLLVNNPCAWGGSGTKSVGDSSSSSSSLRIQGNSFYPEFGGSQSRAPGEVANSPPPSLWVGLEDPRIAAGSGGNNMTSSSVVPDSSPFSLPIATPTPTDGTSPWTSFPSYWPEAGFSPLNSRTASWRKTAAAAAAARNILPISLSLDNKGQEQKQKRDQGEV